MTASPLSNPFILGLLQRVDRVDSLFSREDSILHLHHANHASKSLQDLTDAIKIDLQKDLNQRHAALPLWSSRDVRLDIIQNERETARFFGLKGIYDNLKMVKLPLFRYINESRGVNQLSSPLLLSYITEANKTILGEAGQMKNALLNQIQENLNQVSHTSFTSILHDQNAISRYANYQKREILPQVNHAFNLTAILWRVLTNPFRYWNRQTLRYLRERRKIRKHYINLLHYNKLLTDAALNQTLDNFFHRWLRCTQTSALSSIAESEKESIKRFLTQKKVQDTILNAYYIPDDVKTTLMPEPYGAFEKMVHLQQEKGLARESGPTHDVKKTDNAQDHTVISYPYPPVLLDKLEALIKSNKSRALFGYKLAIADGILHYSKRLPMKRQTKRLSRLSDYQAGLGDIHRTLASISFDFSYVQNTPFLLSFYHVLEDLIDYRQHHQTALIGTEEAEELKCILDTVIERLEKIRLPSLDSSSLVSPGV